MFFITILSSMEYTNLPTTEKERKPFLNYLSHCNFFFFIKVTKIRFLILRLTFVDIGKIAYRWLRSLTRAPHG